MPEDKKNSELVDKIMEQFKKNTPEKAPKKEDQSKKDLKKEASPKIKPKQYYDVKLECMLPATLTYRVLAEDAEQAATLIKGMSPTGVKHRIIGKKDIKLSVYDAGSSMIRWVKNLAGF